MLSDKSPKLVREDVRVDGPEITTNFVSKFKKQLIRIAI